MENNVNGLFYQQESNMFDMRKTGAHISQLRRAASLTQAELAEKLGISYQAVSSWERGSNMPDIGKLLDLARILNTTVDALLSASYIDRGISYDGNGRRIGMNTSGSTSDSEARNLFLKAGYNFGESGAQRLQASYSRFKIEGKANYRQVEGCRYDPVTCPVPTTNTSERGAVAGSLAPSDCWRGVQLANDGRAALAKLGRPAVAV